MSGEKQSDGKQDEKNSEFSNFQKLLKGTLEVPKEEVDKKRDERETGKRESERHKGNGD